MFPTTQVGKETAIEQSRIFWGSQPEFIKAATASRFPNTPEGIQAQKETEIEQSRIFWANANRRAEAASPFPNTPEGLRAQNEYLRDFWRNAPRLHFR